MAASRRQKFIFLTLGLLLTTGSFLLAPSANASWAGEIVAGILSILISALGLILILVIQGLIMIASYQHFIDSQAVILGWVIVRDICNMFFVVILLMIAFGTILNIPNYSYKKWLPKLVLFAVLINFSKTICGLLIDVAQVVMLTFVNAFITIGGANFIDILGITQIVTVQQQSSGNISMWTVVGAYVLGLIYMLVAIVVLVTMMMILAMRLVIIWIYVVLSPAAFLMSAFPGGQEYASQWWEEFSKNLIVGPVLAFFIWLSLAALGGEEDKNNLQLTAGLDDDAQKVAGLSGDSVAGTQASTPGALIKFVVAIGMLVGGLMVAQQIGGAAGSMAGKGMAKLQKGAAFAGGLATGAALLPLKGAKLGASYGVDKLQQKTGVDLNLKRAWGVMQAKRKEIKEKQYGEGQLAAREAMERGGRLHGMLAVTGNAGDAYEQLSTIKGIKKRLKGGRRMTELREGAIREKEEAKQDQQRYKFEEKWANIDPNTRDANGVNERTKMAQENENERDKISQDIMSHRSNIKSIDKELKTEQAKDPRLQDKDKIKDLMDQKAKHEGNISDLSKRGMELRSIKKFIDEVQAKGEERKEYTDAEKQNILANKRGAVERQEQAQDKIRANVPDYNFEARAQEQKLVGQELSKIRDISDADELGHILLGAISDHDKTLVKAVMLKMTKDGNDNEFLKPLAGDTGHKGLKKLMRELSTEGSSNHAGFTQQEAFDLGSQIAELNKATNHWAATAAYKMENGQWRETTDMEHYETRATEVGKIQLQAAIRNLNRLAYGTHDKDGKFTLDAGGIIQLEAIDNADGHKNIQTMNESAAQYVYQAIMEDDKLKKHFESRVTTDEKGKKSTLIDALRQRLGVIDRKKSIQEQVSIANSLGYQ